MKEKLTIQLELKDTFFHLTDIKPWDRTAIRFNNQHILIRNHFKEFITSLTPYFNIAIWTIYEKEICDLISQYISSFDIKFLYCKNSGQTTQYYDNGVTSYGKRLKLLHIDNLEIENIICIESSIPTHQNFDNYFLVSPFTGQQDNDLIQGGIELIKLKDIQNTRQINS